MAFEIIFSLIYILPYIAPSASMQYQTLHSHEHSILKFLKSSIEYYSQSWVLKRNE